MIVKEWQLHMPNKAKLLHMNLYCLNLTAPLSCLEEILVANFIKPMKKNESKQLAGYFCMLYFSSIQLPFSNWLSHTEPISSVTLYVS